jgi:hypothetical protein
MQRSKRPLARTHDNENHALEKKYLGDAALKFLSKPLTQRRTM